MSNLPPAPMFWLEVGGQQRLQRMHARLQVRRQLLQRWSTLVDDADQRIFQRLERLGNDVHGYDAEIGDQLDDQDYDASDRLTPASGLKATATEPFGLSAADEQDYGSTDGLAETDDGDVDTAPPESKTSSVRSRAAASRSRTAKKATAKKAAPRKAT